MRAAEWSGLGDVLPFSIAVQRSANPAQPDVRLTSAPCHYRTFAEALNRFGVIFGSLRRDPSLVKRRSDVSTVAEDRPSCLIVLSLHASWRPR